MNLNSDIAKKWNEERDARARAMVIEVSPERWKIYVLAVILLFILGWPIISILFSF